MFTTKKKLRNALAERNAARAELGRLKARKPTHFVEVSVSARGLYRCDLVDTEGVHVMIHSGRGLSEAAALRRSIDIADGVIKTREV